MRGRTAAAVLVTALVTFGLTVLGLGAEPADAAAWTLQTTPNPSGATSTRLAAVSCSAPTACTAVGYFVTSANTTRALAETWNGAAWRIRSVATPRGATSAALAAVSCDVGGCTAVGSYRTSGGATKPLGERWDGTAWSIEPVPTPHGGSLIVLSGVSCVATGRCVAVGSYHTQAGKIVTLGEVRSGTTWTIEPPANRSGATAGVLSGVSCTTSNACTAVGFDTTSAGKDVTLAERWNGSAWTIQTTANQAGASADFLSAVSCTSSTVCLAVGFDTDSSGTNRTLAETWSGTGTGWTVRSPQNPSAASGSFLNAVSCSAGAACSAVGYSSSSGANTALAETWDGSRWTLQPAGDVGATISSALAGVSCLAPSACTAVGWNRTDAGTYVSLAEGFAPSWVPQDNPNPISTRSGLQSVSCAATDACTAVGYYSDAGGSDEVPFAEQWDGTTWTAQEIPSPSGSSFAYLYGVACTAGNSCTAVGNYVDHTDANLPVAETWNGTAWSVQDMGIPNGALANYLYAVSCTAPTACTAVGTYADSHRYTALVERWDGAEWTLQPTPDPAGATSAYLSGVSCTAVNACTAVGSYQDGSGASLTMAEVWNGSTWTVQATPNPSGASSSDFTSVSCTSTTCVAVGNFRTTSEDTPTALSEVWNGTTWTIQDVPAPQGSFQSDVRSVSCSSSTVCTAAGSADFDAIAERWNGTTWTLQEPPSPDQTDGLSGVACPSDTGCEAVGTAASSAPLAESWDGTQWAHQSITGPIGQGGALLSGVSCASAADCEAVGLSLRPDASSAPLAEHWTGLRWVIRKTPVPPAPVRDTWLNDVSCPAANACTAVGELVTAPNDVRSTFAERWNGTGWKIQITPNPAGNSALLGVSCPTSSGCEAVGAVGAKTLAERWDGTTWSLQTTPNPVGSGASSLTRVSCTASNACTAVGQYTDSFHISTTLSEHWDGTHWRIQKTQDPAGGSNVLSGVSCTASSACTAVGQHTDSGTGVAVPLAERWNGTNWQRQPTATPTDAAGSGLAGVSCSASDLCVAVGSYTTTSDTFPALAERWDGTTWTIQTAPTPTDVLSSLSAVSCVSADTCTAVGMYNNNTYFSLTLVERYS